MAPTSSTAGSGFPRSRLVDQAVGETERSVALANLILEECNLRVHQIDLDFNSDSQYASHKLVSASSGYITSLGFNSKVKPDLLMAAWAANVLCQ